MLLKPTGSSQTLSMNTLLWLSPQEFTVLKLHEFLSLQSCKPVSTKSRSTSSSSSWWHPYQNLFCPSVFGHSVDVTIRLLRSISESFVTEQVTLILSKPPRFQLFCGALAAGIVSHYPFLQFWSYPTLAVFETTFLPRTGLYSLSGYGKLSSSHLPVYLYSIVH